jgi:hypothetical protein
LKFDGLAVDGYIFGLELYTDGELMMRIEVVVDEASNDAAFADACVSNNDDFK